MGSTLLDGIKNRISIALSQSTHLNIDETILAVASLQDLLEGAFCDSALSLSGVEFIQTQISDTPSK